MRYPIVFTADVAGDIQQYERLARFANEIKARGVVLGGDLAPWSEGHDLISAQRDFFENFLVPYSRGLRNNNSHVYVMMGNDDFRINVDVLERYDGDAFAYIHGRRVPVAEGFDIYGYSYVPLTPFDLKDWEKFDVRSLGVKRKKGFLGWFQQKERVIPSNVRMKGIVSSENGFQKVVFDEHDITDTIEDDLNDEGLLKRPERTLYVFHTPPYGTKLDKISQLRSVGSRAVRRFVEQNSPYATLSGHIHESPDISGYYADKVGNSPCFAVGNGNDNEGRYIAALLFDLCDIASTMERRILPLDE